MWRDLELHLHNACLRKLTVAEQLNSENIVIFGETHWHVLNLQSRNLRSLCYEEERELEL